MQKPNNINNNKKRPPKVNPKNADPMGNTHSMQNHAKKLFRDISKGKVDIAMEMDIFANTLFIDNALIVAASELTEAQIHVNAINIAYCGSQDPQIISVFKKDTKKMQAYTLIYQCLNNIKLYNDPSFIYMLANRLPEFRNYI